MIVAGFGFRRNAPLASLRAALRAALSATGARPDALATLGDKQEGLRPLADELGLPVIAVDGPLPDTPTQSAASHAARGTGSVAEACALAAAGEGAYLHSMRVVSADGMATCAIAVQTDTTETRGKLA